MKRQTQKGTWQEGAFGAELMLLVPEKTKGQAERKPAGRRVLTCGRGPLFVSPHCLSAFDRVVFGSQEFEVSCVLEGSVAWLQSVVLNLLLMTRIKGLCKEDRLFFF